MPHSQRNAQLASMFDQLDYVSAVAVVCSSPTVTYRLRGRISEDEARSPAEALAEAELLYELAKRRVREALDDDMNDQVRAVHELLARFRSAAGG